MAMSLWIMVGDLTPEQCYARWSLLTYQLLWYVANQAAASSQLCWQVSLSYSLRGSNSGLLQDEQPSRIGISGMMLGRTFAPTLLLLLCGITICTVNTHPLALFERHISNDTHIEARSPAASLEEATKKGEELISW